MKDGVSSGYSSSGDKMIKKTPLLKKLNVEIRELDFDYVNNCQNVKKIANIYEILRSGEEGVYPQLLERAKQRLEELDPKNRLLRTSSIVLTSESLGEQERSCLNRSISEWVEHVQGLEHVEDVNIFMNETVAPIRGNGTQIIEVSGDKLKNDDSFIKARKPEQIKSWEYDKWDKYDVDRELTKMEIKERQAEEREKSNRSQASNESKEAEDTTEKNVKEAMCSVPEKTKGVKDKPKITEMSSSKPLRIKNTKRKVKIQIEDIHVS